jgi:GT2 family glycosyltransferase
MTSSTPVRLGSHDTSNRVDVTIVVCTRDRPKKLARCLASINLAAGHAVDVAVQLIVVDNSANRSAYTTVLEWARSSTFTVLLMNEPRGGLSRARNGAMRFVSGEIVAFTDDDCCLAHDFLPAVVRAHRRSDGPALIGGKVKLGEATDLLFTVRGGDEEERFTRGKVPGGFILGCNMTMPRELYDRIGPFDEKLGAGSPLRSAEDTDYTIRAERAGIPVFYTPECVVYHWHGRNSLQNIRPVHWGYNVGNGALLAKHWRTSPWVLRQFRWLLRSCARELYTGKRIDEKLGLSHFPVLAANIHGALLYLLRGGASCRKGGALNEQRVTLK